MNDQNRFDEPISRGVVRFLTIRFNSQPHPVPILNPVSSLMMLLPTTPFLFFLPIALASTVLIPKACFDTTASLEQYFTYDYPWGSSTHNGKPIPLLLISH
jgi:hypothetical protein